MTDEEHAQNFIGSLRTNWASMEKEFMTESLRLRFAEVRADEREACAKIALAHIAEPGLSDNPAYLRYEPSDNMAKKIAAAIRAMK